MRIAPPSLPPHHSGPATRDFQSSISVEALFCKLFSELKLVTDNLLSTLMTLTNLAGLLNVHV